jgi:purine-binding chemotaxis protein CheW
MKNIQNKIIAKKGETDDIEEHQHVTFLIGEETYGVGVEKVKEIIGMTDITHVPNTAYFMEGVINLRGSVVPVVDLRKKFKMRRREYDNYTVIIIVEVKDRLIGMIVDSVSDVVDIPISSIQATPHFTTKIKTDFIEGIGQMDNNLVIILDVDMILSEEEIEDIENINNMEDIEAPESKASKDGIDDADPVE